MDGAESSNFDSSVLKHDVQRVSMRVSVDGTWIFAVAVLVVHC
jgi:hypothetical protein